MELDEGHEETTIISDQVRGEISIVKPKQYKAPGSNTIDSFTEMRQTTASIGVEQKTFTFDNVYDEEATQEQVYTDCAQPIIQEVVDGYNGTIFCYGQTGTGKTFTMAGIEGDPIYRGIMPRAFEDIYGYSE